MNKFELFKNFNLELIELIRNFEKELLGLHNKLRKASNNQNVQIDQKNKKSPMWRLGNYIGSIGKNENILLLYKNRRNSLNEYLKFEEKFEEILEEIKNNINFKFFENSNEEIPDVIRKFKLNLNSLIAKYAANLQSDWDDEREEQIRASGHEDRSDDEIEKLHSTGGVPQEVQPKSKTIPIEYEESNLKIIEEFSKLDSGSKINILIKAIQFHNNSIPENTAPRLSVELSKTKDFEKGEGVFLKLINELTEEEFKKYQDLLAHLFPE